MNYRTFGRVGWQVSEVGYGMWGMVGWAGSDDDESRASLQLAADAGVTFFDTAWAYAEGRSERLLGELVRSNPDRRLYTATKIPPANWQWPTRRGDVIDRAYPPAHIRDYTEKSLANLGLPSVDLIQFHVWEDTWADDDGWQRAVDDLRREGLVGAVGVSVNRWEPWNVLRTLRTGLVDSVQVIYNIFDQAPEDELFPLCRELGVAVMGAPTPSGSRQPLQQWATPEFVIESDGEVPLGVDGEALTLPTPLTLRIRPNALRVRIAPQHPGASPAYAQPTGFRDLMRRLAHVAGGADPAGLG